MRCPSCRGSASACDFPAAIAFALNYAAYFAEIFRAGIQSVDRGQYEAAVLGFSYMPDHAPHRAAAGGQAASCRR